MCCFLGVSRSGFHAWQRRTPSARALDDARLLEQVRQIHLDSRGLYGSPRVTHALRQRGHRVGRRRVARLMAEQGLQGRCARVWRSPHRPQRPAFPSVPNRLAEATITAPNQAWVGDVTYLKVRGQWRYLAAVMDRHSRRIVGWSLGAQRDARLTVEAFSNARRHRKPAAGVIFHSDRGPEYLAADLRKKLARHKFVHSNNRPGQINDNAHMESFFHSMKTEAFFGKTFDTDEELRQNLLSYIQFYNQQRLHSSIRYLSPVAFEKSLSHHKDR